MLPMKSANFGDRALGEASGVEWYAVEQISCITDPMECVQSS